MYEYETWNESLTTYKSFKGTPFIYKITSTLSFYIFFLFFGVSFSLCQSDLSSDFRDLSKLPYARSLFFPWCTGDSMVNTEHTGKLNRNLPGMLFSTYDQDNDGKGSGNCASTYAGGWWFNSCYAGYLNGPWKDGQWSWAWYPAVTKGGDVYETLMMIRPN